MLTSSQVQGRQKVRIEEIVRELGVSKMPGKIQTFQAVKLMGSKLGYLWIKVGPS